MIEQISALLEEVAPDRATAIKQARLQVLSGQRSYVSAQEAQFQHESGVYKWLREFIAGVIASRKTGDQQQ